MSIQRSVSTSPWLSECYFVFYLSSYNDCVIPILPWSQVLTQHNVLCLTRVSKTLTMSSLTLPNVHCPLLGSLVYVTELSLKPTENNNVMSPWCGSKHCVVWPGLKKFMPLPWSVSFVFCCCFSLILAFFLSTCLYISPCPPFSVSFFLILGSSWLALVWLYYSPHVCGGAKLSCIVASRLAQNWHFSCAQKTYGEVLVCTRVVLLSYIMHLCTEGKKTT